MSNPDCFYGCYSSASTFTYKCSTQKQQHVHTVRAVPNGRCRYHGYQHHSPNGQRVSGSHIEDVLDEERVEFHQLENGGDREISKSE